MSEPQLYRKKSESEKPYLWVTLAGTALLLLGCAAGIFVWINQGGRDRSASALFALVNVVGLVAMVFAFVAAFYTLRKRTLQERLLSHSMMTWYKLHVFAGCVAMAAALAHAAFVPVPSRITAGELALILLLLINVSGGIWAIAYSRIPPKISTMLHQFGDLGTPATVSELERQLSELEAGKPRAIREAISALRSTHPSKWDGVTSQDEELGQASGLAKKLWESRDLERRLRRLKAALQWWKWLHVPLGLAFVVIVGFHSYRALRNAGWLTSHVPSYASASDCAQCHASVVQEWKLSAHANAETSSLTIAQTKAALDASPEFDDFCVGCHAPIGTKFSESDTFPLVPSPGYDGPEVQPDGVTCIVCHASTHVAKRASAWKGLDVQRKSRGSLGDMKSSSLPEAATTAHDVSKQWATFADAKSDVVLPFPSETCAGCHDVILDMNGDGSFVNRTKRVLDGKDPELRQDLDDDGILDQNELDAASEYNRNTLFDTKLNDLVLQTTFDEWQNVQEYRVQECASCHMSPVIMRPDPPLALFVKRANKSGFNHLFAGVDYELELDYYRRPGMPKDGLKKLLERREALLAIAASLDMSVGQISQDRFAATVTVSAHGGHGLPTGFAFMRQIWLDVSAKDKFGAQICLAAGPHGIKGPCASGRITSPQEDLPTCDPSVAGLNSIRLLHSSQQTAGCDPWLINFQRILTDGDADGDGVFSELPYQVYEPDIVTSTVRPADGTRVHPILPDRSSAFTYVFQASSPPEVTARLRFRHIPPYLLRALGNDLPGKDVDRLTKNLSIVDLGGVTFDPQPSDGKSVKFSVTSRTIAGPGLARFLAENKAPSDSEEVFKTSTGMLGLVGLALLLLFLIFLIFRRFRDRS